MQGEPAISLSNSVQTTVKLVGHEQTPVIIFDDFATDIQPLLEHAREQKFQVVEKSHYPGIRTVLPKAYVFSLLKPIWQTLRDVYSVPSHLKFVPQLGYYSLVSVPTEELTFYQKIPHFDSNNPYYFAILHFLNPGKFSGTGFFRHNPTGFERINKERLQKYFEVTTSHFQTFGEPASQYITESSDLFCLYDQVEYKPNRLVIYPGNLLHSGLIRPDVDVSSDPKVGRLTANIFVEFQ